MCVYISHTHIYIYTWLEFNLYICYPGQVDSIKTQVYSKSV